MHNIIKKARVFQRLYQFLSLLRSEATLEYQQKIRSRVPFIMEVRGGETKAKINLKMRQKLR